MKIKFSLFSFTITTGDDASENDHPTGDVFSTVERSDEYTDPEMHRDGHQLGFTSRRV